MLPSDCSAIVLAGGRSSRMGGQDKALLPLHGETLMAHVIRCLRTQVDDIIINSNRHHETLAGFGLPVIADQHPDFPGPLAGIAAALPHCRHEWVLVVPCDSPWLPQDLQARLAGALSPGGRLAIAHDGERLQPLFMLLHKSLQSRLVASLTRGHYKVGQWCQEENATIVRFDDVTAFANLNTPEDWQAVIDSQQGQRSSGDYTLIEK